MNEGDATDEGRPLSHQERVKVEREALSGSVDRLHNFVNGASFDSVTEEEQGLLKRQLGQMQGYLATLDARIAFHESQA